MVVIVIPVVVVVAVSASATRLFQLLTSFICLPAVFAMTTHRFVQLLLGFMDAPFTTFVGLVGPEG